MTSQLKSDTARANGAKSHGPKTPQGKARSSRNALKHGITGKFTVLPGESQREFERFLNSYIDHYQPENAVEMELVHTMAVARWRLRRVGSLESNLFRSQLAQGSNEQAVAQKLAALNGDERLAFVFQNLVERGQLLALLLRYEGSLQRLHDRAARQLDLLRIRSLQNEPSEETGPPQVIAAFWANSREEALQLTENKC